MSLASFEFRHLNRHLKPEEIIPPLPSLVQQVQALVMDLHEARNQPPALEDEEVSEFETHEEPEDDRE